MEDYILVMNIMPKEGSIMGRDFTPEHFEPTDDQKDVADRILNSGFPDVKIERRGPADETVARVTPVNDSGEQAA